MLAADRKYRYGKPVRGDDQQLQQIIGFTYEEATKLITLWWLRIDRWDEIGG